MQPSPSTSRRVCLIGAGFISHLHAEALRALPGVELAAIVDPNEPAARAAAARWGIAAVHSSLDAALAEDRFDVAHVLTPPASHAAIARRLIEAGKHLLVEKPFATSAAACTALTDLAQTRQVTLGVNQNFVFHPAFARLKRLVESGRFGPLKNLACIYMLPLRQLQARQFGHWMFHAPVNLLLEQAVHPLSQILALVGAPEIAGVAVGERQTVAPGQTLLTKTDVLLRGGTVAAQFHFELGAEFPHWELIASCADGVVHADMVSNRCYARQRTRWLEPSDQLLSGLRTAAGLAGDATRNALGYGLSLVKLRPRSDAYFRSMQGALGDFYAALGAGRAPVSDGAFATRLVQGCEAIATACGAPPAPVVAPAPRPAAAHDLLLIGGTGFIGKAVLKALGGTRKIGVFARNTVNLPAEFHAPHISLIRGDFTDAQALEQAIAGSKQVTHLAHGLGAGDLVRTMLAGTELIAEQCLRQGVARLIYVSSIAALYLGDAQEKITAETTPDPQLRARAEYARAKALCDQALLALQRERGLPVVILRPGLVVGEGGTPFHSGLGFYNNEQHCMGWSPGRTPLPFVLVDDVAAAIVAALEVEGIEGRTYNLVGDVRPDARSYTAALASALRRPLQFHGQTATRLYAVEWGKWLLKRAGGRQAPRPSQRDLRSRALLAQFDCGIEKRELRWQPNADEQRFAERAIDVYRG